VIGGVRESLGPNYQLLLSVTDSGEFPKATDVRKLMSLRPAGLLVDAPNAGFLADLSVAGPLVLLDAPGLESFAPAVNLDVAQGARELAAHLAEADHRRVAYLDSVTGTETFRIRREAFLAEAAARGMSVDPDHMPATTIDVGAAAAAFAGAWQGWQRAGVTAVVCATDTHAYGVLQEARVAGVRIPAELAVAGFDDLPYSATSSPGLTSVHLPAANLGLKAGEQLRRLMEGQALEQEQLVLGSSLVVRGSTSAGET
jgi:DNA-binding LacI/PurR family transcriptional regulator